MNKKKINIGILFGGKSAEHEVSLQSAKNVFDAINKEKYNPILIGIDKSGKWLLNKESKFLLNADDPKLIKLNQSSDSVALVPQSAGEISNFTNSSQSLKIDIVFPILHGPFGEDGTVQGLLKLANLPFVGASVLGSAVGMDKDIMKRLLRDAGIPIGKFIVLKSHESIPDFQKIKDELGLPFFVKPANMGSSVGVNKIHDKSEYENGIIKAFDFDTKIILEEFIKGREIECSVLGNEKPIASVPGEIISNHEFYSYDAKYIDENGSALEIPAKISDQITRQIQELAIKTFQALSCEGLGRVDFFLKDNGEIIINEINTIPGFTKISMYPKLWEASGISYTELIDKLIQLAIERFNKEQKLKTNYKE
ncbi:D-alanine--D-alanine ligase [Candidatus Uhrbacteria bacterium CG_4_10_14_0_2_um_filter_41_7]|uniref:D-alanine--D-alanine ligase n=1 Tax=Candidatus Uhrbacteria bacterium CG_4_9_14_3_um_filter_41_35 TaxID=1975034 RepID=A0A2M7XFZ4_9BACT|nr:MAG: D-alanine--D-alanine ligase [Candidatus Uhrbacteria bacterium CG_4_10_14_0_2_um_filter_41_7]PJA46794.1 MAG: D-alanine--D-alanine ligase [Candidatus Uhrbacteria bacterium CG_4_9_14_3_um_filter_41_35]